MFKRIAAWVSCLVLALCLLPAAAPAEEKPAKVLVGWYETPFNKSLSQGRRTGYSYEYQRKITAYTGWTYDYIPGTWPELLEKVRSGEIDLMSDVSKTEEREQDLSYADLPMGTELYYLYVSAGDNRIRIDDPATLKGKRVGVTEGSFQRGLFVEWAGERSLNIVPYSGQAATGDDVILVELSTSEEDSLKKLHAGGLDAFITLDTYGDSGEVTPLWKIGSSDFYFVVSKKSPRHDKLLAELNDAMNRIQDEDKHYNEKLSEKYLKDSAANRYLTTEEKEWLDSHGPIRIGYQDNYLAFCAKDPDTGELTGALKDYLAYASDVLENASLEFEAVCYPTANAALEALRNGEVDCMFPANLTDSDAESMDLVITQPMMRTQMDAVVRKEDAADFLRKSTVRVGVNKGNQNYQIFLDDHFPSWTSVTYDNTPACLDAVAARDADCIIISNYRYSDIARQCERLNLTTVYSGVVLNYCLAVRVGDTKLYSILSKAIGQVPDATVNAALTYYSTKAVKTTFWDYIVDHLAVVLGAVSVILLGIIFLMYRRIHSHKKLAKAAASI